MIRFLLGIIVLIGALVVGAFFIPIATALKYSGAAENGVEWTDAKGSILSGRLEGLKIKGTEYGTVDLKLDVPSVFKAEPRYDVDWSSTHGTGTGKVTVASGGIYTLEDYAIDLDLLAFDLAAKWVQKSGGRVKLEGSAIRFQGNECLDATGTATSDVLDRNRDILGAGWSELRGDVSCDDGKLLIPLESENPSGTRFIVRLRAAPGTAGKFEARVAGVIPRTLNFALPLAGFSRDGDEFVFVPKRKTTVAVAP